MNQENEVSFKLGMAFYPKESIMQAASMFEDVAEIHIDILEGLFSVKIKPKEQANEKELILLKDEFCNACLLCTNN